MLAIQIQLPKYKNALSGTQGRMLSRTESFYFRPDTTLKYSIAVKVFKRNRKECYSFIRALLQESFEPIQLNVVHLHDCF